MLPGGGYVSDVCGWNEVRQVVHTWALVVADSEVRRHVGASVAKAVGAVLSRAADLGGRLPHDLAEVTPVLEVDHARAGLAVETIVPVDLAVVEHVGDDTVDTLLVDTSSDVLAVATTPSLTIHCQ